MKESVLSTKSFHFSIQIIGLYKYLVEEKNEKILSKQLLRSGTSVGALVRESRNAESRADFVHKLGIAQKECDETIYWLELLKETEFIDFDKFVDINNLAMELLKIIKSSILTCKANMKKN